jgi:hypothetical protein
MHKYISLPLFNDAVTVTGYTASNVKMIRGQSVGKVVSGKDRDLT